MDLNLLLKKIVSYNPKANLELVKKAYHFADEAMAGEKRLSGESYLEHFTEVAGILADSKLDEETIAAALIHSTLKKTSLEEIEEEFPAEVVSLVKGISQIKEIKSKSKEAKAEAVRKMLLVMIGDLRVLLIKLADKLHNLRTISYLPPEKQKKVAKEVLELYAPLAYRLGIDKIKGEMEDLAFRCLEPEKYKELEKKLMQSREEREKEVEKIKNTLAERLAENNLYFQIKGRPKQIYSIYKKMLNRKVSFNELRDIIGLRIFVKEIKDCYTALGVIHQNWKHLPEGFKDYIVHPKLNGYQSIHTAVIGPNNRVVEIQIRTTEMNELAEEGVAAHWKYKGLQSETNFEKKLAWIRQSLDLEKDGHFLEEFKKDILSSEIYCYTPKGEVIELPVEATPVDFAYAVHSKLGDICAGAKVNGTFVSLRHLLKTGDVVEILTNKNQRPSREWLKFAASSKAKHKIKEAIEKVEKIPVKILKKKIPVIKKSEQKLIEVEEIASPAIKMSKCCNPLPGEEIVGFATKTGVVSVHKKDCLETEKATAKKERKTYWRREIGAVVEIKIEAQDRTGLLADLLHTVTASGVMVKEAKGKLVGRAAAECTFKIVPADLAALRKLIERIKKVRSVRKVSLGSLRM